jgi:hypothetical protein
LAGDSQAQLSEFERLEQLQKQLMREIKNFRASDRLTRDEVHARKGV